MLIVVSSPHSIKNEAFIMNNLFEHGLELLHLRKPEAGPDDIKNLMEQVDERYYSRIVFHNHHQLARGFGIKRLHFPEELRKNTRTGDLYPEPDGTVSTSVHTLHDFRELPVVFNYAFIGPVFNSISKPGYRAVDFGNEIRHSKSPETKPIAIGGICRSNLSEAMAMGFDGVAVLGCIWENMEPVKEFIQLKKEFSRCAITH